MIKKENFKAVYKGQEVILNHHLATRRLLNTETMQKLIDSHVEKLKLFEKMEATDDRVELRKLAAEVDQLEGVQQVLWKFPPDPTMHCWYEVPKCTCPKLNQDARGTKYRVYDLTCPIHGD